MRTTSLAVAVAAAALLSGCSGQGGDSTPPAPSSVTPSPSPSATDPGTASGQPTQQAASGGPAACRSADLGVTLTADEGGGGMNKTQYELAFTNKGSAECVLQGFPGVSFVTGDNGTQVGAPATRQADGSSSAVTLQPGANASSHLTITNASVYDPAECGPTDVRGLRIYPPGETAALFVATQNKACSAADKSTASVGPVRS
ncbi:DUF4232 domain-containing protein [Lentzea sp. NPDC092896]|uniref:DUF4232 domain-containing protein n=1 Tax=Lentzea sp. NPDC092896 TaxID=3364127 RepID=UPI00382E9FEE